MSLRAGAIDVDVVGATLRVAWHGQPLLCGTVVTQPDTPDAHLTARIDGDAIHVVAEVRPHPGVPLTAAWLSLQWTAPIMGTPRAWVPHLRPGDDDIIADHAFRSPVAAIEDDRVRLLLLPDIDLLAAARPLPGAFDIDLTNPNAPRLAYGLCATRPHEHVWFQRDPSLRTEAPLRFAVRMIVESSAATSLASACARLVWRHVGATRAPAARVQALPFIEHASRAYDAVFRDEWIDADCGGPIHFGDGGTATFFQAWYHALRSAVGIALAGKRLGRPDYLARATQVAALVDAMPDGPLLPTFYDYERQQWWGVGDDLVFSWVGRDPDTLRFFDLPDACETAAWMLAWNELVEPRPSFLRRVQRLGDFLVTQQADDGSLPCYFDQRTLTPSASLRVAAQCAVAGPVLLHTGQHAAALRLADFLCRDVVATGRYVDFETFFSCSYKPTTFVDRFSRIPAQNTLSMRWTADFLMQLVRAGLGSDAQQAAFAAAARRSIDQLCLYQQVWEPPFLSYRSFGGFGVMNTDGEWSDARQGLFALSLFDAYRTFGVAEYFDRGVAALRAAFALQAIPENRLVCPTVFEGQCPNWPRHSDWGFRWDRRAAAMQKMPPGKMIENYAHGGYDSPGVRSGFDWGEGSAAACALIATQRFGEVYVDVPRRHVFGIDGVNVHTDGPHWKLEDFFGATRHLRYHQAPVGPDHPRD